jgi:8-oxo-dGTP pyrophosphatase MutT (NUDIX family)
MSTIEGTGLIPSATILLTRDGPMGLEVFMVVRHHKIDSFSGALVFPGGKVDRGDTNDAVRARIDGADGLDDREFSMRVAAIREAYEECGVLLAREEGSGALVNAARLRMLEPMRNALNKNELDIGALLEKSGLRLAADLLTPFAHWITPNIMPKRFDTRFYLASAPEDHLAVHDGSESVDSVWIRPADAIAEAEAGTKTVIFPTRMNVLKLGRSPNVAHAIETARSKPVVTVEPKVDGKVLRIPAEAEYDVTEEPLTSVRS